MTTPGQNTGIYTRMSQAAMDDQTKVEDQARISRDWAAGLGWRVTTGAGHPHHDGIYTDNNRSAWQRNRKRPGWDQMLADIRGGLLDAIVVYHGDRLIRQPRDLEDLIDLADGRGIRLAAPTGMRNLDSTDDRFVLRILVAQACMESDNTSRRKKAQYARERRAGIVRAGGRGGRVLGFESDSLTHVPAEVALIRDIADRVLAGEPATAIGEAVTAAGWRTPAGRAIGHDTIRRTLCKPRYAGLMPDGETKAAWDAVLPRDTWEAMCAVLESRAARFAGKMTNIPRYLLSGLATCGPCGETVQIRYQTRRPDQSGYGCVTPGCMRVQRNREHLDYYVIGVVVARLAHGDTPPGRVLEDTATGAELRALAAERAAVEEMVKDHRKGRADLLMARLDSIDARMDELRARVQDSAGARLLAAHAGISREEFRALPLSTQRALVAATVSVTVLPSSKRGPGFREEDVVIGPPGSANGGQGSTSHSADGVGMALGGGSTGSVGVGMGTGSEGDGSGDGDGGV